MTIMKKILCLLCAAALAAASAACGGEKQQTDARESNPYALSDPGVLENEGYVLPFDYGDGFKAVAPVIEGSTYVTAGKTPAGNMTFHLTTDKSKKEVERFYDDYFAGLPKVKAKKKTDDTTGYFDKDNRLILFNFYVWTADGKTNYKMGAAPCDSIENSKDFELVN